MQYADPEQTQGKKRILEELFLSEIRTKVGSASSFQLNDSTSLLDELCEVGQAFRDNTNGVPHLSEAGRKAITVVLAGGSFDIIHPGHVETLEKAKSLGELLVVSVSRNSTYLQNKKRNPLHDEELRRRMVESIKYVDVAILGSETDIFDTVERVKPDIIALGYDQSHNEEGFKKELARRGLKAQVVRLDSSVPEIKTSRIAKDYY